MNENIISISQYMKWVLQNSSRVGLFSFSKRGNRHTLILASSAFFNSKYLWLT